MNYISFSLWGAKPIYNIGAIKNAELCTKIYPNWKMIIYYDNTVPLNTIKCLNELNVLTIDMTNSVIYQCFWRFLASEIDDCEYAIFRDCDSRISEREKLAVDEWILSKKTIHIMRDHPAHGIPYGNNQLGILAGMWGIKGHACYMSNMITDFIKLETNKYGVDQSFLKIIYAKYNNDRCTHDEYFEKMPFPKKREDRRFIGERIDINEEPLTNDYLKL